MHYLIEYIVIGVVYAGTYAVTSAGIVVTYTTSGVFNFAHGAIGMVAAFTYWALHSAAGWPTIPAAAVVVLLLAPLAGALIEGGLIRRLHGAPVAATIGVTLGLLLALYGGASWLWSPDATRTLATFFPQVDHVTVFGVNISYDQLTILAMAVVVAAGLRLLMYNTRAGISMRAVVDDRHLLGLAGRSPGRSAQLGWMIGCSLAALGGVIVATENTTLDIEQLTLLVVSAYGAAVVGRLRSFPLTFLGALILGEAVSFSQSSYMPQTDFVRNLQLAQTTPMIVLFALLLLLPAARLRISAGARPDQLKVASLRTSLVAGAALVGVTWVVSGFLTDNDVVLTASGIALGLVLLSLVPLTGYAGQVSLCQLTFAGVGAFAMGKWFGGASPLGLLAAVLLSAAVGVVVALPAIRLQGIYLALATLAFASGMDFAFFQNTSVMGSGVAFPVGRAPVGPLSFGSDRSYLVLLSAVFALVGIGVLALRRSRLGRRLVAMNDSSAASATVGISLAWTKLLVFGLSAGLAGLAGALMGGVAGQVTDSDFEMFSSLAIVLLATVWGIRSVSGALLAALTFVLLPALVPSLATVNYIAAGFGAIAISRNPEGIVGDYVVRGVDLLARLRRRQATAGGNAEAEPAVSVAAGNSGNAGAAPVLSSTARTLQP